METDIMTDYWIEQSFQKRAEVHQLQALLMQVKIDLEIVKKGWRTVDQVIETIDKELNK